MSKKGKDYKEGGTYFLNDKNVKINTEEHIDVGDVGIFYASMIHGVDTVSKIQTQNLKKSERWWIGLYSPESDYNLIRKSSNSVLL